MIQIRTHLDVADNTGARVVWAIGVIGRGNQQVARIGDVITVHVREADPDAAVKKGEVTRCVVVRQRAPLRRPDGTTVRFDSNAVVLIDSGNNPRGTRVFGPVARELRERRFMKIISLAPEVV